MTKSRVLLGLLMACAAAEARAADTVHAIFSSSLSNTQLWSAYLACKDRGVYAGRGIDIDFVEGQGGGVTAQVLANHKADIGLGVAASAVINVDGQGGHLRMIGTDIPVAAIAILSKPPKVVDKPQDLVGTTIGIPPGTSQALAWPGFLSSNGLDPKSIRVVNVQLATMRTALLQGQLDSYLAYSWSNVPLLKRMNVADPHAMLFSDFGFKLAPDSGVVVDDDMIRDKPDLLKRFMAASSECLAYAFAHPLEAGEAGKRMYPATIDPSMAAEQLQLVEQIFKSTATPGKPLMWMSPADWETQVKTLTQFGVAINPQAATTYYTNEFLPVAP